MEIYGVVSLESPGVEHPQREHAEPVVAHHEEAAKEIVRGVEHLLHVLGRWRLLRRCKRIGEG